MLDYTRPESIPLDKEYFEDLCKKYPEMVPFMMFIMNALERDKDDIDSIANILKTNGLV